MAESKEVFKTFGISPTEESFLSSVEPLIRRRLARLIRAGLSRCIDADDLLQDGLLAAWQAWLRPPANYDPVRHAVAAGRRRMTRRDISARRKRDRLREMYAADAL